MGKGKGKGGKKGKGSYCKRHLLPSFAEQKLSRVLADKASEALRQSIQAELSESSPSLAWSAGARKMFEDVCAIYRLRGFSQPSPSEIEGGTEEDKSSESAQKHAASRDLRWIDCRAEDEDDWQSVGLCVQTSVGPWQIVVQRPQKTICSVYPVIDRGRIAGLGDERPEKPLSSTAWTDEERAAERRRLTELGQALKDCRWYLQKFMSSHCEERRSAEVWRSCKHLQAKAWEDCPELVEKLSWGKEESWRDWTTTCLEVLDRACSEHDCVRPVRDVHFTHDSIGARFRHGVGRGEDIEELVQDLRNGRVDPLQNQDLVLETVCYQGRLHSLNNRRLWALQQHQLLLFSKDTEVSVRVRVLPWSDHRTIKRFLQAYDNPQDAQVIHVRSSHSGAPTPGVVATTLQRAVQSTGASLKTEQRKEAQVLVERSGGAVSSQEPSTLQDRELQLGAEKFSSWKDAKQRVQVIMRTHTSGQAVPRREFVLLVDLFKMHPSAEKRRISEITSITVGPAEKDPTVFCFWIWRADGTGEDISVNKIWKRIDLESKTESKFCEREVLDERQQFEGSLEKWFERPSGSFGFLRLLPGRPRQVGDVLVSCFDDLYLEWADILPDSQERRQAGTEWPFPKGAKFAFKLYKWKGNGKVGCMEVSLA
eukprot:TRINITY_DN21953_c1_g1_i1.p1 TRINITY_DN21953_c1_g1~~TRINITY_DN21953_c1_g1_i1.p1  ORF type:complete len:651 (+),score=108.13 TRINITY_DN21953_c1_g1_i1:96-2048(+)